MTEKFKSKITLEKFLQDCEDFKVDKQTYDVSYLEFLKYFKDLKTITKHNLVVSINFTYGWMPTIFDFRSDNFNDAIKILNNAKNGNIPTVNQLDILKGLFNNSLVGTTKLLHFINPEKFAIWDSRVYRYLTKKEAYNHRIGNCETYLSFLTYMVSLTQEKDYEKVHNSICKKLGYPMTKLRTAELIMYLNGGKPKEKQQNTITSIQRISALKYNKIEYKSLVQQAFDDNKLFMVILDNNKFSKIEYDLESIKPKVTLSSKTNETIILMYEDYVKSSKMNIKDMSYAGGSRSLIIKVKKNDAEMFANKLYKFITNNLELLKPLYN